MAAGTFPGGFYFTQVRLSAENNIKRAKELERRTIGVQLGGADPDASDPPASRPARVHGVNTKTDTFGRDSRHLLLGGLPRHGASLLLPRCCLSAASERRSAVLPEFIILQMHSVSGPSWTNRNFFLTYMIHGFQVPDPGRTNNLRREGEELCAINKIGTATE
jgi:hypothetical protein